MGNILNCIFCHFEFVVCFAPPSHKIERNTIVDLGSTADSVESKRWSGDTPSRRVCLCKIQHGDRYFRKWQKSHGYEVICRSKVQTCVGESVVFMMGQVVLVNLTLASRQNFTTQIFPCFLSTSLFLRSNIYF